MSVTRMIVAIYLSMVSGTTAVSGELPDIVTAGENGYVTGELIYPLVDQPIPQCHASTIVETPSGLVASWFGGTLTAGQRPAL